MAQAPIEDPNDDESDDSEDEEEEEEETAVAAAVARPAPSPRRNARKRRSDVGVARPKSHESIWVNAEADLRWAEILQVLRKGGRVGFAGGQDAYEVQITLRDLAAPEAVKVTSFEGASVMGDANMSPAEALSKKIEEIHMSRGMQGTGKYRVDFTWKHNSQPISRAVINIDAPARIIAMRNMQMRENMGEAASAQPPASPQGMGRPQQPYPQYPYPPPPQYPFPAYGYGQPESSETMQLRADLARARETEARTQGMLDEIIRAQKEGRAPNLPPQQAAAATTVGVGAPPAMDVETVVERVLMKVLPVLGIGKPVAQPQATAEDQLMKVMKEGMNTIVTKTMQQVMGGMQKSITGMGEPIDDDEPPPATEIVAPTDPKDSLSFVPIELEQKWPDGSKVGYAVDKETGNIDWKGTAFANPFIAMKAVEVVQKVGEAFADGVKKIGVAGPHIVHNVPQNAQPGVPKPSSSGFGGGWE